MGAPTTGSIEVTVTDWVTTAVATGGCVSAITLTGTVVSSQCTGSAGVYLLDALAPGSYLIRATNFPTYVTIFAGPSTAYSSSTQPAPQRFDVVAGGTSSASVKLLKPGQIGGRVLGAGGNPVAGAVVEFYRTDAADWPSAVSSAVTDAAGWYVSAVQPCGAPTCVVRVAPAPGIPATWYPNAATRANASAISVGASWAVVAPAITLIAGLGRVDGTLVAPAHFTSPSICYALYDRYANFLLGVECGTVGTAFAFDNVPAGAVRLCAIDAGSSPNGCNTAAPSQWSGNATSRGTDIAVTAGATTTFIPNFGPTEIHVQVSPNYNGYATDGCVDLVLVSSGAVVDTECTAVGSEYHFVVANPNAVYTLTFYDFDGVYDSTYAFGSALAPGMNYYFTQFPTRFEGSFYGYVYAPAGVASTDVCLRAEARFGPFVTSGELTTCADASGAFNLPVPRGTYKVLVYPRAGGFVPMWIWQGGALTPSELGAEWISVNGGAGTYYLNLTAGSRLTGTVRTSASALVPDGCVRAFDAVGAFVQEACVNASGVYDFSNIAPATYRLRYSSASTGASQWIGGSSWATASDVVVGETGVVTRNITLAAHGTISGTVTDSSGQPATGGCAEIYSADTVSWVATACSGGGATYAASVLPGSYVVHFGWWSTAGGAPLGDEWYDNVNGSSLGTPVVVAAGTTRTVNAGLTKAPTILNVTIDVTDGGSHAAHGGCVEAYTTMGDYLGTDCTGDDGVARFRLDVNEVVLYADGFWYAASSGSAQAANLWSGNSLSFETASPIAVASGTTTAVSMHLTPGRAIDGWVTLNNYAPTPLPGHGNGVVEFYVGSDWTYVGDAPIAANGKFTLDGLPAGEEIHLYLSDVPGAIDGWVGEYRAVTATRDAAWDFSGATAWNPLHIAAGARSSITGNLLKPPWFDDGQVCADLWQIGPTGVISGDNTLYFIDEICGADLEPYTFAGIPAGTYAISYYDASGNQAWDNSRPIWGTTPERYLVMGMGFSLDHTMVRLKAPETVVYGQSATITVTAFPSSEGALTALVQSTDGTNFEYVSPSVPFVNGVATLTVTPTTGTWYSAYTAEGWTNVVYIEPILPTVTGVIATYVGAGSNAVALGSPTAAQVAWSAGGVTGVYQVFQHGMVMSSATTGTFAVLNGPIRDLWGATGGSVGSLGWPTGDVATVAGGTQQAFQNGVVFAPTGQPAVVMPSGAIGTYFAAGSNAAALGSPTAAQVSWSAGGVTGVYQVFQHGMVMSSATTGTFAVVNGPIRDLWGATGGSVGSLGWPTGDVATVAGGTQQAFQNGVVFAPTGQPAVVMPSGAIGTYFATGSNAATLGSATASQVSWSGGGVTGVYQVFQHGMVMSSATTGTFAVLNGPIRDLWGAADGSVGSYGWPTGDQQTVTGGVQQAFQHGVLTTVVSAGSGAIATYVATGSNAATLGSATAAQVSWSAGGVTGVYQVFQHGMVMSSATTGTFAVLNGPIRDLWGAAGGSVGSYGWPTGDQQTVTGGVQQAFQHGVLTTVVSAGSGAIATYVATGSNAATLGSATASQVSWSAGGVTGVYQVFQHGTVMSSATTGTFAVLNGPIRDLWGAADGSVGSYGWPTGDQQTVTGGVQQAFQHGVIVAH